MGPTVPALRGRGFDGASRDGRPRAFATLYDRHGRMAYSLAYRMMGEKQEAEDVVQEAFIKVWRSAGGYRVGRGSVRTWILSVVRNRGIDQIRSHGRRGKMQDKVEASAPTSEPSEAFAETWKNAQQEQVREALNTTSSGAAEDTGAGVLLGLHPRRDSRASRPAPRDGQGPDEARAAEAPRLLPSARRGGAQMNGMDQERFEDLKDAYVLGALPEEERLEFEQYLVAHPDLQLEIEELGTVAGLLALSPQEQEPPPELRRRIMDTVEAEAVRPRTSQPPILARRAVGCRGGRDLALAAATMLVIGLFSWSMLLQGEVRDLQGRVQSLQSQPQGPQMIALGGGGTKQGARAELVTLEGGRAVLVAENMPPVPEGKTYQIWVIKDDTPKPSGLFEPRGFDRGRGREPRGGGRRRGGDGRARGRLEEADDRSDNGGQGQNSLVGEACRTNAFSSSEGADPTYPLRA